jgi:hypothetical protein
MVKKYKTKDELIAEAKLKYPDDPESVQRYIENHEDQVEGVDRGSDRTALDQDAKDAGNDVAKDNAKAVADAKEALEKAKKSAKESLVNVKKYGIKGLGSYTPIDFNGGGNSVNVAQPASEPLPTVTGSGEGGEVLWKDLVEQLDNNSKSIARYLNENPSYVAGEKTKQGMKEFGYEQDENGKWVNPNEVVSEPEQPKGEEDEEKPSTEENYKSNVDIDNYFSKKGTMPRSIWKAWKDGYFGKDINSKDAKEMRNYFMLNSALNAISNAIGGFKSGLDNSEFTPDKSLWQQKQAENVAQQTQRENEVLNRDVERTETRADKIFDVETQAEISNMWNSLSDAQKQGFMDAKNAIEKGDYGSAETLIRNSMGKDEYAKWVKQFEDVKQQLSINADTRANTQLEYMMNMGPAGMILQLLGLFR